MITTAEVTQILDESGWIRLKAEIYRPGQSDSHWAWEISNDILEFVKNYHGKLPMTSKHFDTYLRVRNW